MNVSPSDDQVRAAHDLGAQQLITWPFPIEILCDHLDSLVHDARREIANANTDQETLP
jgi:hypothetical protein